MAFGQSILAPVPGSILGGQPQAPRVPWSQNKAVTMAALGLIGAPTLNVGMQRAASLVPAGMDANAAWQKGETDRLDREKRSAAMNAWMRSQGGFDLSPEEMAIVESSPEVGEALFGASLKRRFEPQESYRPLTDPAERAQFGIAPDDTRPYQLGPGNKLSAVGGGGTNVSIDTVGTIPQGYELVTDPTSGAKQMRPIPGGPADTSKHEAAAAESQERYGDVVLEDIRRAKEKVKDQSWYAPVTGAGGSLLSNVGGSAARDTAALIATVQSSVAFDRLQKMREASPTGGALGAVSERELGLLQSTLGSLDQSQSQEQLLQNLDRLEEIYTTIMQKAAAYPNAAQFGFSGGGSDAAPAAPAAGVYDWSPDGGLRPAQ